MRDRQIAPHLIAAAFAAGPIEAQSAADRIARVIAAPPRAITALVRRLMQRFSPKSRPTLRKLASFVREDHGFRQFSSRKEFSVDALVFWPRAMRPAGGAAESWPVLPILTIGDLASLLNLPPKELAWFADLRNFGRQSGDEALRHYHYRWLQKRNGNVRLIESPKSRLKSFQRFLLAQILQGIPAHEAAHGFRKGRSVISFAAPHAGQKMVLRLDLKDFFTSITLPRVRAVLLTAGYPDSVANILAGLFTHVTPPAILRAAPRHLSARLVGQLRQPHLPQGAPTSPGLANLCAFRLDCRLDGLARAANASYTRYADDLVFSGDADFARSVHRFYISVCRIALEEGFEVHTRKTRLMRASVSQRAGGLVLNAKPNIPRKDYDNLKAIIHNAAENGLPANANPEEFLNHLRGRIAHVHSVNPKRGEKLKARFAKISATAVKSGSRAISPPAAGT